MIECENVWKGYNSGHGRREILQGVSFSISRGERVALLGRNGAGKTTLIKQIGGVELPDTGRIVRNMSSSWPIGFNGGFQGSMTGYDNARFIARIYGVPYATARQFVEGFTELGGSLSRPVKTYSSGMRARLAFALSLVVEFDCYLIDEVILVGDKNFQEKCRYELFEKRADRGMVIASHDMNVVREVCNRAIIIENGQTHCFSDVDEAIEIYNNL